MADPRARQLVEAFLRRHGFVDVARPRDSEPYTVVRMAPVYPVEVARELHDELMVEMLSAYSAYSAPTERRSRGYAFSGIAA